MDPGESDLDSSFPQTENPCLIVEDSQPDSVALEDDPDTSYRALLARRLSNLQPTSQSPVLELISSPTKSRCLQKDTSDGTACSDNLQSNLGSAATEHSQVFEVHSYPVSKRSVPEHMEPEANSTTHDEMSQFGLLELSESQGVFEEDEQNEAPANQTDSQKPASQFSCCYQVMFTKTGTKADSSVSEKEQLPTSTPAHSLRLLHLSGQGTLVQESLSQQSVDFVAATQDNLSQTPYIIPNSPTEKEQNYNEAAESPMDTSAPAEDQPPGREETPMDMDPCPKPQPTASTPVSQNSPGFVLDKSLSVPSQPEFSHDVFISTPSLEHGNSSQGTESSKKLPHHNSPSASPKQTGPAEQLKKSSSSGSQPSGVAECFQLELSSENSSFAQKTQLFVVEEDSQATQIVEEEGTVGADKSNSSPKNHSQNVSKNRMDPEPPVKTSNSQSLSKVPDSTSTSALTGKAEDCEPSQKISPAVIGKQNISASPGATPSQLSVGADTPNAPQTSKATVAECSNASPSTDRPVTPVPVPQQSPSQSVLTASSQKNTEKEKEHVIQSQRLSQPVTHSHSVVTDSVRTAEEEERMDEGEIQSVVIGDDTGIKLGLSESQVLSPEPMEEEKETSQCEPSRDEHSSSKEESFSVMVLEESQRVSQEKVKEGRSQPFRSSTQPVRGSVQDKREATAKISGSQPVGSTEVSPLQLERTKSQSTQPSDTGQHKKNSDNAANKSLSDSSGELPFHFTLPKEGELIRPAVSSTPPQISQLKKTPRHSTPIEMTSFSEASSHTKETTMVASEISVEESREGEEPAAVEQDGKLSLRMKLVTPVEEGSSGSEHFSLQSKSHLLLFFQTH
ncbi:hypothetical protein cypCar_00018250 [Cyprinus carpio]|nr:hypothetical protein cypCar_00018250 [Cyprinus carpio]